MLALLAGCDDRAAADTKAEARSQSKSKAQPDTNSKTEAEPRADGRVAVADYPKAIIGKWKKVKSMISVAGTKPMDVTMPGVQQFLEFEADGTFINSGVIEGKEHSTQSTYTIEGDTFRVGSNQPFPIELLTADRLVTRLPTEGGAAVDEYERVPQ